MRLVLLLLAALIAYGSLFPFGFVAKDASWEEVVTMLSHPAVQSGRGDVVGNLLLFLPYGFVAAFACRQEQGGRHCAAAVLLAGAFLAVVLQVAQIWIPGRVAAIGDAILNVLGMLPAYAFGRAVARRQPASSRREAVPVVLLPVALALLWVAYRWFPLVPTLDLQNVKNALKPLLRRPGVEPVRVFHDMMAWLAWFQLMLLARTRWSKHLMLAAAALAIVAMEPLFVNNTISAHNLLGLGLALALMPWLNRHVASALLCGGMFLSLLLSGLLPFQLADPPNTFSWLPFSGFLTGSMVINTISLVEKTFLIGALLYLMRDLGSRPGAAAVTVAAWLGLTELMQVWIAGRTAEITDPLLALMIAFVMACASRRPPSTASAHRRTEGRSPKIAPSPIDPGTGT